MAKKSTSTKKETTVSTEVSTPIISLPDNYNELATSYANKAKQDYENSLSYLIGGVTNSYNTSKDALTNEYNNLVSTLNNNYQGNARQAYVNKMLTGEALNEHLANLGVSTQGFGVGQRIANENTYASNLSDLQNTLQNNLTSANSDYQNNLASLFNDYQNRLMTVRSQIAEGAQQAYNNAYNDYANVYAQEQLGKQNTAYQKLYDLINTRLTESSAALDYASKHNNALSTGINKLSGWIKAPFTSNYTWNDVNTYIKTNKQNAYNTHQTNLDTWTTQINNLYNEGTINAAQVESLLKEVAKYQTNKKK